MDPDAPQEDAPEEGGDSACWLDEVCEECGGLTDDRSAARCARCGAPRA